MSFATFFFALIYGGGLFPAFRLARNEESPFLMALVSAIGWPAMLGGFVSTVVSGGYVGIAQVDPTKARD